ncbi:MAG TPA: methylated-DNA--[protein]-cysteine S-methyltransferase [Firmicutes bacterium]|nr:methylated-DNA--[protein]-cysteine S-methyltransferase [Bacillota bacterium]
MKHYYNYPSPVGNLLLGEENGKLTLLAFNEDGLKKDSVPSPFLKDVAGQLDEYFAGKRREFDVPLAAKGTDFQKDAWHELLKIPYGETRSYKQIAERIGRPKAYRAVGLANNRNPIAIIIPCHRVVGSSGKLVGYGGGLSTKEFLLDLESKHS